MLSLRQTNRITFNVNIFGTASTPTVRCVVGETPGFTYPAIKLANGEYEVTMDLPYDMKPGATPFKVEVLLNGRLFTPIQTSIDLQPVNLPDVTIAAPAVTLPPVETPASAPAPAPEPTVTTVVPAPGMADKLASIFRNVKLEPPRIDAEMTPRIELPEAPVLGALEKLANATVQKRAVPAVEIKTVKISMADVANEAERRHAPSPAPKPAKKKAAPKAAVVETKSIPIKLIKGDIIYR